MSQLSKLKHQNWISSPGLMFNMKLIALDIRTGQEILGLGLRLGLGLGLGLRLGLGLGLGLGQGQETTAPGPHGTVTSRESGRLHPYSPHSSSSQATNQSHILLIRHINQHFLLLLLLLHHQSLNIHIGLRTHRNYHLHHTSPPPPPPPPPHQKQKYSLKLQHNFCVIYQNLFLKITFTHFNKNYHCSEATVPARLQPPASSLPPTPASYPCLLPLPPASYPCLQPPASSLPPTPASYPSLLPLPPAYPLPLEDSSQHYLLLLIPASSLQPPTPAPCLQPPASRLLPLEDCSQHYIFLHLLLLVLLIHPQAYSQLLLLSSPPPVLQSSSPPVLLSCHVHMSTSP